SRDLQKLHSFPTRRSSDLQNLPIFIQAGRFSSLMEITSNNMTDQNIYYNSVEEIVNYSIGAHELSGDLSDCMENKLKMLFHKDRSEEHTSELQSRENLVCR